MDCTVLFSSITRASLNINRIKSFTEYRLRFTMVYRDFIYIELIISSHNITNWYHVYEVNTFYLFYCWMNIKQIWDFLAVFVKCLLLEVSCRVNNRNLFSASLTDVPRHVYRRQLLQSKGERPGVESFNFRERQGLD